MPEPGVDDALPELEVQLVPSDAFERSRIVDQDVDLPEASFDTGALLDEPARRPRTGRCHESRR